jgi:hypothetical protein
MRDSAIYQHLTRLQRDSVFGLPTTPLITSANVIPNQNVDLIARPAGDRSGCESFFACLHQVAHYLRLARIWEKFARRRQLSATPSRTTPGSISCWDILSKLNECTIQLLFSGTSIP